MMEKYKVLWVDDQVVNDTFRLGFEITARKWNLLLESYSNWKEACRELERNFDSYSAIILDAYCKMDDGGVEGENFISRVLLQLTTLFNSKGRVIPWYIFSEGTMGSFNQQIETAEDSHNEQEWGAMLYIKSAPEDDYNGKRTMFDNIVRVAQSQPINVVLHKHSDIFQIMSRDPHLSTEARKLMLNMLRVLYYPEEFIHYEYAGNPLRKVLEYLFRSARDKGLVPEQLFDGSRVMLQLTSLFMAGQWAHFVDRDGVNKSVRWGDNNEYIFPKPIAAVVKNILEFANVDSHTQDEDNNPWQIGEDRKYLFIGYVLQMCCVIKSYGDYIQEHPNKEENSRKIQLINSCEGVKHCYNGVECVPQQDEDGVWYYEKCFIYINNSKPNLRVRLKDVRENTNPKTNGKYPYFAKCDNID